MKKAKPPLGYVDRGMLMPAYPTPEQIDKINAMQPSLRACWNWLVSRIEEPLRAKEAAAVRSGLVSPPVVKPDYTGMNPDTASETKHKYIQECTVRRKRIFELGPPVQWRPPLSGKGSEAERLGMKQGYQVLNNYLMSKDLPTLPAIIAMKLEENFKAKPSGQRKKTFRTVRDWMPVQSHSGERIRLRIPRPTDTWSIRRCNAEVYLQGVGWIAVYLHASLLNYLMTPGNYAREGCTLKCDAGRWSASVLIVRREIMNPGPGDNSSVGIDPGLDKLAAMSDGSSVKNPRNLKYADARQLALSIIFSGEEKNKGLTPEVRKNLSEQVYRHDARQKRRVLDACRKLAARLCREYEFIGVEKNSGVALGSGHRYVGATYLLAQCLIHRCGSHRVREIDPYYNSQTCSQCGEVDKATWERKIGSKDQTCTCAGCGYTADRDLNAARNVNRKLRESLGLAD